MNETASVIHDSVHDTDFVVLCTFEIINKVVLKPLDAETHMYGLKIVNVFSETKKVKIQ